MPIEYDSTYMVGCGAFQVLFLSEAGDGGGRSRLSAVSGHINVQHAQSGLPRLEHAEQVGTVVNAVAGDSAAGHA